MDNLDTTMLYRIKDDYLTAFDSFKKGEMVNATGKMKSVMCPIRNEALIMVEVSSVNTGIKGAVPQELLEEIRETVDSTSNDRVTNNVMRHEYRVLSETEKKQMQTIKDLGLEFFDYIESIGNSRELSLAKTKVEEAVMWAVKHITK